MFKFCSPISSKKRFIPFREINSDFCFSLYERVSDLPAKQWDSIIQQKTIFLERDYLNLIENIEQSKMGCRYVMVYYKKKICGILYFQIIDFEATVLGNLIEGQLNELKSKRIALFEKYINLIKKDIFLRLFTCGNNIVSGENGILFNKKITEETANEISLKIIDLVSKEEKIDTTFSAILIKDFRRELRPKKLFERENYKDIFVDPNLVVILPDNIVCLNDYINLFSKKYRNRAKSILNSCNDVEIKYLTNEEIKVYEIQLYQLYEEIFEKAKFKLIKLPVHYFSSVKNIFKEKFQVKVFMIQNKIIAFGSYFFMPDNSVEAHYIGFKYSLNKQYNLYQNLLYSVINEAILKKQKKINLGRTASEIKTTVGAKVENLICYVKPRNTISKLIINPFIEFLQPEEWIPRNPFKKSKENLELIRDKVIL